MKDGAGGESFGIPLEQAIIGGLALEPTSAIVEYLVARSLWQETEQDKEDEPRKPDNLPKRPAPATSSSQQFSEQVQQSGRLTFPLEH